ncbi:hypothetical protein ACIQU1_21715 [Streptomyces angustmyceticus]|uniref:hypothetical protein n=1 Tax=Streptomyces angustmyceticus TaxID=285578 RepID=UPI00381BD2D2
MTTGAGDRGAVRQEWEPEGLIEVWPMLEEDQERLRNTSGTNRLGFALLLKFFEVAARFPEDAGEIPWPAVESCGVELNRGRLAEAVVARCRKDRLEPPAPGQIARLVVKAVSTFEGRFCAATVGGCRRRPVPGWTT